MAYTPDNFGYKSYADIAITGLFGDPDQENKNAYYSSLSTPTRNSENIPAPGQTMDVTDFMPNAKFGGMDVQQVNVALDKPIKAGSLNQMDMTQDKQQVAAVKSDYIKADQAIKNTFFDKMKEVCGVETMEKMRNAILPGPEASGLSALGILMDPTGTIGAAYSTLSTLQKSINSPKDNEIRAAIEKTLNAIHKEHDQKLGRKIDASDGPTKSAQAPKPEEMNYPKGPSAVDALLDYFKRDVNNDPVMQQANKAELAIKHNEQQVGDAEANYTVDTEEKAESAAEAGVKNAQQLIALKENAIIVTASLSQTKLKGQTEASMSNPSDLAAKLDLGEKLPELKLDTRPINAPALT